MSPEQKAELEQMCDDLGGVNKEKFRALLDDKVAKYNSPDDPATDIKAKRRAERRGRLDGGRRRARYLQHDRRPVRALGSKDAFGIDPTKRRANSSQSSRRRYVDRHGPRNSARSTPGTAARMNAKRARRTASRSQRMR